MVLKNKYSLSILVILLLALSYFLYNTTIFFFPSFIHAWAQSDHYALVLGFLKNGFNFFLPSTFNLQNSGGLTAVDFPLNEFVVALLMKVFGTSPFIFRIYTLTTSIVGLCYLFLSVKKISKSELKSFFVVLFVFLSPVYTYYQIGFLPCIPAISCLFISFYYLIVFHENKKQKHFIISIIFLLLASLIRFPFIIFLIGIFSWHFYSSIKNQKIIRNQILVFIIAFSIFIFYFLYNLYLKHKYDSLFIDEILPARNFHEFKDIVSEMMNHWGFQYFSRWQYIFLLITLLFSVFTFSNTKTKNEIIKHKRILFLFFAIGALIYFLLMSRHFFSLDYLFLDVFFIPVILLFVFSINNLNFKNNYLNDIIAFSFLIFSILFLLNSKAVQAIRYSTGSWDRVENTHQNFIGSDSFLNSSGVSKEAKILVIDAYTTNAPLILMNRNGFTVSSNTKNKLISALINYQWDYVAIQDNYLVSDAIKNFPQITSILSKVFGNGKISFYTRNIKVKPTALKQFLAITSQNTLFSTLVTFDEAVDRTYIDPGWRFTKQNYFTSPQAAVLDSLAVYGANITIKAKDLKKAESIKVFIKTMIQSNTTLKKVQLVASLTSPSGHNFYQNYLLSDYLKPVKTWQMAEFQLSLPKFKTPEDELKIYFYNPAKEHLNYDQLEFVIYR